MSLTATKPKVSARLAIAVGIAAASAVLCSAIMLRFRIGAYDFNWSLRAARDLLAHRDPYAYAFDRTIPYPLPAALFALPFTWLKPEIAAGAFFGISSGLLAFALTRDGFTRLMVFLAYPYWAAMLTVQWSPLVTAGALFSWLLPVAMAKPQIGLPVFLTRANRRGVLACVVVGVISLLVMPSWPMRWLSQIGAYQHFMPLLCLPGPALLCALYRKEDPDTHLLLLLAVAPQRWFYEAFVLWLIPKNRNEFLATAVLSWGAGILRWYREPSSWTEVGSWAVWWIYLPMAVVLLIRSARTMPWQEHQGFTESSGARALATPGAD